MNEIKEKANASASCESEEGVKPVADDGLQLQLGNVVQTRESKESKRAKAAETVAIPKVTAIEECSGSMSDTTDRHKINTQKLTEKTSSASVEQTAGNANDSVDSGSGSLSPPSLMQSPKQQTTTTTAASETTIPLSILSPPKSETQTDETNTTSLSSSSPNSDSQQSQHIEAHGHANTAKRIETLQQKPKTSSRSRASSNGRKNNNIAIVANGSSAGAALPQKGKLLMSAVINRMNKAAGRVVRPPRKQKAKVPLYESEISDNKVGIKLCIKKSDNTTALGASAVATGTAVIPTKPAIRKRARKTKTQTYLESDDSETDANKRRKERTHNNNVEKRRKQVSFSNQTAAAGSGEKSAQPVQQTIWGARVPYEVLLKIFQLVVPQESSSLPAVTRLARVCLLWRRVSLEPLLWRHMDLSKEKNRTELKLKWLIDNRCSQCKELNVANWKMSDINCFLQKLVAGAPNLEGISLAGWKNFTGDHLTYLVDNMHKLQRLDLSSINVEMNASKTAVGVLPICNALKTMGSRLTHLYLAHNRLAGVPQIVNILATHCPNLLLLDLSNVTTQATSHGILHIEKLQHGCQKLRVLRVTNSHVILSTATLQEQMDAPGFPDLEELSIAALVDESRVICDEHVQRILKTSAKLKLLDVRGCARLTHEVLIRLPAWDIKHLFLSGCSVTRDVSAGLELIASKWAHSLIELDLAWANVQHSLDCALYALAEKGAESPLAHLNLCGSSVSEEAVKDILANCAQMSSINLSSCRGLPRGVKRLMQGAIEIKELREVLKVQTKFKLPAEVKEEQEEQTATTQQEKSSASVAVVKTAADT